MFQLYNLVPAKGQSCSEAGKATAGLAESNGTYRRVDDLYDLTCFKCVLFLKCMCFKQQPWPMCTALSCGGECAVFDGCQSLAWAATPCDGGVAWQSRTAHSQGWIAAPRGQGCWRHHQRPTPTQTRPPRPSGRRRRFRLGLLRNSLTRSLLRQIRYVRLQSFVINTVVGRINAFWVLGTKGLGVLLQLIKMIGIRRVRLRCYVLFKRVSKVV